MMIFIAAALLGLIPAAIAQKKGRNAGTWWLFGALLFIIALPCAILMPSATAAAAGTTPATLRPCPSCAESIQGQAIKCRFCGADVERLAVPSIAPMQAAAPAVAMLAHPAAKAGGVLVLLLLLLATVLVAVAA